MVSHRHQIIEIILASLMLFASACNYQTDRNSTTAGEGAGSAESPVPEEEVTFQMVQENVFMRFCQDCHSSLGVFTFDDPAVVKGRMERIHQRVFVERNMPPSRKLPEAEENLLMQWLELGGPE